MSVPKRSLLFLFLMYAVSIIGGCDTGEMDIPRITGTDNRAQPPLVSKPEPAADKVEKEDFEFKNVPRRWFPPKRLEKGWKAIILHHSATNSGSASVFDNYHKNGHNWDGIGYDFVIGNGKGSGDGQVEVTYRWKQQITGAHVGKTSGNWANEDGIGICLVGDFTKTSPSQKQMQSLVRLVRFLQKRYNISNYRIYGHNNTPGYTGGTKCPGRKFPMAKLKAML